MADDMTATDAMEAPANGAFDMNAEALEDEEGGEGKQGKNKVSTWKRTGRQTNAIQLSLGDNDTLPLNAMQMSVVIDGFRARVVMDCYFQNDRGRQLEGTFKLRLPNGASPYYLAFGNQTFMDKTTTDLYSQQLNEPLSLGPDSLTDSRKAKTDGLKEAVVTTRDKASLAYTSTARRRVDPALMEWAGADVFNCRVFPLLPNQTQHIVVGYEVNLEDVSDDFLHSLAVPRHDIPLVIDYDVVSANGSAPKAEPTADMKQVDGRYRFRYESPEAEVINVHFAKANVLLKNENFFAGQFTFKAPSASGSKAGNSTALFMVDVSLSSNPDKFNVWQKMMEATLRNNRDAISDFNVLFFNVEGFFLWDESQANTEENLNKLLAEMQNLSLEGATDIGLALDKVNSFTTADADLFLLSDGGTTWGESDLNILSKKIAANHRLFAYRTGMSGTDLRVLEELTRQSGGAVISVVNEEEVAAASKAYRKTMWKINSLELAGGNDLLLAGRPAYLYDGQPLILSGTGSPQAGIKLNIAVAADGKDRESSVRFNTSIPSTLAQRVYGQIATGQLEEFGYLTESFSEAFSAHFRVAGKTSSFVMLESQADYDRFNIDVQNWDYVVSQNAVSTIIANVKAEAEANLGDPKKKFMRWLERMEKTPGLTFEMNPLYATLVNQLETSEFAITATPLTCSKESRYKQNMGTYTEVLKSKELEYDAVVNQASQKINKADALKTLSSLVERNPGDAVMLRDVSYSAIEYGYPLQAYQLLARVAEARPYEPQTYHAMAQALANADHANLAVLYYEMAIQAEWDSRFGEFRKIVALDYLHLLGQAKAGKVDLAYGSFVNSRIGDLNKEFDLVEADLMVTITWNTDNTDIDLHVIEPSGEECYYSHPQTASGGQLSQDVTQGYGPEMYYLTKAPKGDYQIKAHYYSSNLNRTSTRTKVSCTLYRNWGRPNETVQRQVITLENGKDKMDLMAMGI